MRVEDLRLEHERGHSVARANVVWEQARRDPQELWFSVPEEFGEGFSANPNAFLVGASISAMYNMERRILVEGEMCRRLAGTINQAMRTLAQWYRAAKPIEVDGPITSQATEPKADRTASFLSGGIDSLATIRRNRLAYDLGHPSSVRESIVVRSGFDPYELPSDGAYWPRLEKIAAEADLTLIPITTNLRSLEPNTSFFLNYYHGAVLAALAHTLDGRADRVLIGSSVNRMDPEPWGSHPYLDPYYSSGALTIDIDMFGWTRFGKLALIGDWPTGIANLRVCRGDMFVEGAPNCGACEKCIRTLIALTALDLMDGADSFPVSELTADRVDWFVDPQTAHVLYFDEMFDDLEAVGRADLIEILEQKIEIHDAPPPLRQRLKQFEADRLGGPLRRWKRLILSRLGR